MADPETSPHPPEAGLPAKDRMIPSGSLRFGQTPFDGLTHGELLRLVQAYHSALVACGSLLRMSRVGQEDSPFWGPEGSGGIALGRADSLMELAGENDNEGDGRERIYHAFFRYAVDLLFPDAPNGRGNWRINEQGEMMKPGYPEMRPLEWRDLMPSVEPADG